MEARELQFHALPAPSAFDYGGTETAFLNHLRFLALECRAKASIDLFETCAELTVERTSSRTTYAEALVRGLDQALGKRALLFRPGTTQRSFDESWLLQTARALACGDGQSATFLMRSRVRAEHRRSMCQLLSSAAADLF